MLDATVAIVHDPGIEKLSVRRITQHLGVSPMAIFNYFASKQELLAAVLDARIAGADAGFRDGSLGSARFRS